MNLLYHIALILVFIGCQDQKQSSGQEEKETVNKTDAIASCSDTTVIIDSLKFDFLNINKEIIGFKALIESDTINLGKITSDGLTIIDTSSWNNQLGSIPYLWFGYDSLTTEFNHANFEGESFYLVGRYKTSEYIWNIIGGFCGDNICTYHLLIQDKSNKILFFNGLGFVGFNYNPISVEEFMNDRFKYSLENCTLDDYDGAKAEVERFEITISLDNEKEEIKINSEKINWTKNKCN